ncbi:MAG: hypothetical protein FWF10_10460 [Clostridiales bacterium]|nr:hypothetical protein [Clostridiales bacterium]
MKTHKRIINLCLLLLLAIAVIALAFTPQWFFPKLFLPKAFSLHAKEPSPVSLGEGSTFHHFEITDGKVIMTCRIELKNSGSEDIMVRLYGYAPRDFALELLKSPELFVFDENGKNRVFIVPANTSVIFDDLAFFGEHARSYMKANRLLPDIIIEMVEEGAP